MIFWWHFCFALKIPALVAKNGYPVYYQPELRDFVNSRLMHNCKFDRTEVYNSFSLKIQLKNNAPSEVLYEWVKHITTWTFYGKAVVAAWNSAAERKQPIVTHPRVRWLHGVWRILWKQKIFRSMYNRNDRWLNSIEIMSKDILLLHRITEKYLVWNKKAIISKQMLEKGELVLHQPSPLLIDQINFSANQNLSVQLSLHHSKPCTNVFYFWLLPHSTLRSGKRVPETVKKPLWYNKLKNHM